MKNVWILTGLMAASGLAMADETGRVLSSTPVIQQMPVTRQVCSVQPVVVGQPKSGAGAAIGAIAGGAIGNAIGGSGGGRAAATMLGLVGGAMVGDQIEGAGSAQVQNVPQCMNQTFYENRAVAWNVVYEYRDQQYTVQMPSDPGPTLRLQVTPVGVAPTAPGTAVSVAPAYVQPPVYAPTVYTQPTYVQPVTVMAPYPVYYARPYYPPLGVSLNFGYSRGYGGYHGHWR